MAYGTTVADGTPVKGVDDSRLWERGWRAGIDFRPGLAEPCACFEKNRGRFRG